LHLRVRGEVASVLFNSAASLTSAWAARRSSNAKDGRAQLATAPLVGAYPGLTFRVIYVALHSRFLLFALRMVGIIRMWPGLRRGWKPRPFKTTAVIAALKALRHPNLDLRRA